MDFEKAYQKFLNGTATEEEIEFVRSEMKKASEVNDILDHVKSEGATKTAERETVHKAVKSYRIKDTIKILAIVFGVVLVIAIISGLAVAIPLFNNAKDNTKYTMEQAKQIAIDFVSERHPETADKIKVYEVEKELEAEGRFKNARYIYVIDVYNGVDEVYEIEIDSKTGNIIEVD